MPKNDGGIAKYIICRTVLGSDSSIEITPDEFEQVRVSRDALISIHDLEEEFDCIIENYRELELECIQISMNQMLTPLDDLGFFRARTALSRRLMNLLTSARLYIDTFERRIKIINPAATESETKVPFNVEFDSSLAYRIMEALRNYAQHHSLPVHGLSTKAGLDQETGLIHHSLRFGLDLDELVLEHTFKKKTLEEMRLVGDEIDLRLAVRDYIAALARVHEKFRMSTREFYSRARSVFEEASSKFTSAFPDEGSVAIAAMAVDNEELRIGEPIYVRGPIVGRIEAAASRTVNLSNIARLKLEY